MKAMKFLSMFIAMSVLGGCSNSDTPAPAPVSIQCSPTEIAVEAGETTCSINVTSNREYTANTADSWITLALEPYAGKENTVIKVTVAANGGKERTGNIAIISGTTRINVPVKQAGVEVAPPDQDIQAPDGYELVWHDEFDSGNEPGSDWYYETGGGGWGNNELQNYVAGYKDKEQLAIIKSGILNIIAKKIDGTVYSVRMNSRKSWKYGYFEARLKLPSGKGTWPAFWMMPKEYRAWPDDGEIDIMEEVGYHPNYVSSSIHCKQYNHSIGTQKTKEILVEGAQSDFHLYALEWTENYIRTYVDGKELFYFENDKKGNKNTWPFNAAFYLKLNLAWGGNWGGAQGVDESCLPATYEIDYVRVFQKK